MIRQPAMSPKLLDELSVAGEPWLGNVDHTRNVIRKLPNGYLRTIRYKQNEQFIINGVITDPTIRNDPLYQYSYVPLGLIVKGEVVVLENGKGVKRLFPGDFLGVFESGYFYKTGHKRKIGRWSLLTDTEATILYVGDVTNLRSKPAHAFRQRIIDLAKNDIVPQPLTDVPLLDATSDTFLIPLLDDTIVIAHTHLLPSNFALLRHLASVVDYPNLIVVEKPYSTLASVRRDLIKMGAEVLPVHIIDGLPYDFAIQRTLDVLWSKVILETKSRNMNKILIIDDGADVLTSVPWNQLGDVEVLGVEQTQRGSNKLIRSVHRIPRVVDVGSSKVKKDVESIFIGQAIVAKIVSEKTILKPHATVCVVGCGSIGKSVAKHLRARNFEVIEYDIRNHTLNRSSKHEMSSIDTAINVSDVVIGCTGVDFLRGVSLERINGTKTFISAASADVEFYTLLNVASFPNTHFNTVTVKVHETFTARILNGGYPINFDRKKEWEDKNDIQLTRTLMYLGTYQVLTNKSARIQRLKATYQKYAMTHWI